MSAERDALIAALRGEVYTPPPVVEGEFTDEDDYCLWQREHDYSRPRFVYRTPEGQEIFGTAVAPCGARTGGYPYKRDEYVRPRGRIVGRPIAVLRRPRPQEETTEEELEGPGLDPRQDARLIVAESAWPRQPRALRTSNRRPVLDVPDRRPTTYTLLAGQPIQIEDEFSPPSDPYYGTYYDMTHWGSGWRPPFFRGQ
nr:hypothetical protein [Pandoravirus massiliensis]